MLLTYLILAVLFTLALTGYEIHRTRREARARFGRRIGRISTPSKNLPPIHCPRSLRQSRDQGTIDLGNVLHQEHHAAYVSSDKVEVSLRMSPVNDAAACAQYLFRARRQLRPRPVKKYGQIRQRLRRIGFVVRHALHHGLPGRAARVKRAEAAFMADCHAFQSGDRKGAV